MAREGNAAAHFEAHPSRLPDLLVSARTPLEVLCALAEEGAAFGFDLWAMAAHRWGQPEVYLCTVAPLPPVCAASQLAHFVEAANEMPCEGDVVMPDWSQAPQRVVYLQPQAALLTGELAEYRDVHLTTGQPTGVIIRAAAFAQRERSGVPTAWTRLPIMIQYVVPYLRAMCLYEVETSHGMIDLESGMYSWAYFVDALEREVNRAQRHQMDLSVAVLELRPRNALSEIPPLLQRRIGEHIVASIRRSDLVGRMGKRTYAILFHGTGPRLALIAAGRIAETLKRDEQVMEALSFSLGVSGWERSEPIEANTLLAQASEAAAEAALIAPGSAFVYV